MPGDQRRHVGHDAVGQVVGAADDHRLLDLRLRIGRRRRRGWTPPPPRPAAAGNSGARSPCRWRRTARGSAGRAAGRRWSSPVSSATSRAMLRSTSTLPPGKSSGRTSRRRNRPCPDWQCRGPMRMAISAPSLVTGMACAKAMLGTRPRPRLAPVEERREADRVAGAFEPAVAIGEPRQQRDRAVEQRRVGRLLGEPVGVDRRPVGRLERMRRRIERNVDAVDRHDDAAGNVEIHDCVFRRCRA